jgi:hypothetical protein
VATSSDCGPEDLDRKVRPRLSEWYSARRHSALFLSILVTLILAPIIQECHLRSGAVESLYLIILTAEAGGIESLRGRRWAALTVILTAVLRVLGRRLNFEPASEAATVLFVGLSVMAAATSFRFAFQGERENRERLGAALSTYLLAGQVFGVCYWQIAQLRAGSFAVGGVPTAVGALDLPTSVYFSFVTLATLGYGDIVPLTPTARGLAVSEAIVGQLYLAVLVARLVGARRAD